MTLEISLLRASDAAVLGPEHNRVWRAAYRGLMADGVLDGLDDERATCRWLARAREHERTGVSADGATTWVARERALGGRPVGWMSVGPARDEDAPHACELWALNVIPECWGAGVAAALLGAHLPAGATYLWVLDGNERAIGFYRKHGFELDGATKPLLDGANEKAGLELRMVRG